MSSGVSEESHHVLDEDLVREASAHVEWLTKRNPDPRPENLDNHLYSDHDPDHARRPVAERLLVARRCR